MFRSFVHVYVYIRSHLSLGSKEVREKAKFEFFFKMAREIRGTIRQRMRQI